MSKVIAVGNQKGGDGKSTTTGNLGIGLAREGKKVLLIDADSQGSLTARLGYEQPDEMEETLANVLEMIDQREAIQDGYGILHHEEGVDLLPSNIELSGVEFFLEKALSRETLLRRYVNTIRDKYDYVLIDCMPSLSLITMNAFTCADSVLIPVQAAYLPYKGLEQLFLTLQNVRDALNPDICIEGILLTMVDNRTTYARDICQMLRDTYKNNRIFKTQIPFSVRAAEMSAEGVSIFRHDPKGKVAKAYLELTKEVLANE
jgi:chromosome partitioning protein